MIDKDTVAIILVALAAVIWLSKEAVKGWKVAVSYKNGTNTGTIKGNDDHSRLKGLCTKVEDLWDWHKPIKDPTTGQPVFHWYADSNALSKQLQDNKAEMVKLRVAIGELIVVMKNLNLKDV